MSFSNAKTTMPKAFADKIVADREWKEFRLGPVVYCGENMMAAKKKRAAVLIARDKCASFINNALKP